MRGALRHAKDVVVLDGASIYETAEVARAAGASVVRDTGRGKGAAIRGIIPKLTADVCVFMDADGSHDPEDILRLVGPIRSGEADHVTGSRLLGGSSELHGGFDEWARLSGSSFITACINRRFRVRLSDSQNGFRAVKTEVLRALSLRSRGFTIEQEMIIETLRKGYRMAEVPAHEHARKTGKSHINVWRDGWSYLPWLIRLLF